MASLKAIAAAADRYSFMLDGAAGSGVVLAGRLGSVAAWEGGLIEEVDQAAAQAASAPYWACHADPVGLERAQDDFARFAGLS